MCALGEGLSPRTSAAQNGPVLQICPQCGAVSSANASACSLCDSPFTPGEETSVVSSAQRNSAPSLEFDPKVQSDSQQAELAEPQSAIAVESAEPEWRLELARRLHAYRARRGRADDDDSQPPLPFSNEIGAPAPDSLPEPSRPAVRPSWRSRPRGQTRVEIRVDQPEFDFSVAGDSGRHPEAPLVPVAELAERRFAGLLDGGFVALAYIGFLSLFRSLGGQLSFEKFDWIVYGATFFLFYVQYFVLFTVFSGDTPGMRIRGLSVVSLDGSLPGTRQLLWRSFGYVLSGSTLLMGFLWSLWDEDHFTWQDRISQTYLTAATPVDNVETIDVSRTQQNFAHK